MPLSPGTRLGPYEIAEAIGAGGMGEVYKAQDTRLDRTVAVKVLARVMIGFGETTPIITLTRGYPEEVFVLENEVIANCYTVQQAVEIFAAQNNGEYPDDVAVHATPAGDTVTDLLPGGVLLTNPSWNIATEPGDGAATQAGQTGYTDTKDNGVSVGYHITGFGVYQTIITISMDPRYNF